MHFMDVVDNKIHSHRILRTAFTENRESDRERERVCERERRSFN